MILSVILISASVFSQGRSERKERKYEFNRDEVGKCRIADEAFITNLTDDQKEKIKTIKVDVLKKIQPLENQIGEKEARLKTLTSQETIDFKETDQAVNEIFDLKAKIRNENIRARQKIRGLLTDEQRVFFDRHPIPYQCNMQHGRHKTRR